MSELYTKYVENKSNGKIRVGVANAISRREISGKELDDFIIELEANNQLNDADIDIIPQSDWNEKYLKTLSNESVGGTFSKKYLLYLGKVAEYVENKKKKNALVKAISAGIVVAAVLAIVIGVLMMLGKD